MSTGTGIEWTDASWNCLTGCTRVSAGCDHCYAAAMTHRLEAMGQGKYSGLTVLNKAGDRHFNGKVKCHEDALEIPLRWKKPRMIFVNSMSDLFHKEVPFEFIDRVFAVMALCPQHTFQILTKRPERMAEYFSTTSGAIPGRTPGGVFIQGRHADVVRASMSMASAMDKASYMRAKRNAGGEGSCRVDRWPLANVWIGTSCENQQTADERIPHLLRCPAAVRFLSCEPMLGAIEFSDVTWRSDAVSQLGKKSLDGIHWVIVGGESGGGARPCNVDWIRSIVQQCQAAGVPCFVKQLGKRPYVSMTEHTLHNWGKAIAPNDGSIRGIEYRLIDGKGGDMSEWTEDLRVREMPASQAVEKAVPG